MAISETILIASLSSPAVMLVVQHFLSRKNNELLSKISEIKKSLEDYKVEQAKQPEEQLKKIEEIRTSLEAYKIEQAYKELSSKNWELIEKKQASGYDTQEWIMLKEGLSRLVCEEKWPRDLQSKTNAARLIIEGERNA